MDTATLTIDYPADFVERVKAMDPTWSDLHRHLDSGSIHVGPIVKRMASGGMVTDRAVQAALVVGGETLEKLVNDVERMVKWAELYREWIRLVCANFG